MQEAKRNKLTKKEPIEISSQVSELEMKTWQETETKREEIGCSREPEMRSKAIV